MKQYKRAKILLKAEEFDRKYDKKRGVDNDETLSYDLMSNKIDKFMNKDLRNPSIEASVTYDVEELASFQETVFNVHLKLENNGNEEFNDVFI